MTEGKRELFVMAGVFAAGFLFGSMVWLGSCRVNQRLFYDKMAAAAVAFSGEEERLMQAIKDTDLFDLQAGRELLGQYGYEGELPAQELSGSFLAVGLLAAGICTAAFFFCIHADRRRLRKRTEGLTQYLRQVEEGNDTLFPEKGYDILSNLEDEIYKTVLALRESRESLRREKERLAENLADISHQFKTPLTALSVLSELLLRHVEGTGDAALVRRMEGQTERMAELAAALLTLSRADAGVLTFEIRQVPVSELIECSLEDVLPLLEKKRQQVKVVGEGDILEELFLPCDLSWTRQALGNLLKNACEHAPEQTEIFIRVWDNPVFSGIAVEDQGEGFSGEDLRHLFERFYRGGDARGKEGAEKDYRQKDQGQADTYCRSFSGEQTGLGLSLARALIEGQNGEIRAENRRDGGARFFIKFYKNV